MPRVEGVVGCSDGGCIWGHPGGMHTNGGCKCTYYAIPKIEDRRRIETNIRALRARVAELEGRGVGYSQQTVDAITAERESLRDENSRLSAENARLRAALEEGHD